MGGSVYANADTPLTYYSDYMTKTEGTADFQGLYRPAVVVNTGEFSISPVSFDMELVKASSGTLALEVQNYSGNVAWDIIDTSDDNSSYPVRTRITSSDNGHKASLTFPVPRSADRLSQDM